MKIVVSSVVMASAEKKAFLGLLLLAALAMQLCHGRTSGRLKHLQGDHVGQGFMDVN